MITTTTKKNRAQAQQNSPLIPVFAPGTVLGPGAFAEFVF